VGERVGNWFRGVVSISKESGLKAMTSQELALTAEARDALGQLFSDEAIQGFDQGAARHLISSRNKNLGNLLLSERNVYYLQLVYRMLCFRREHDLEPLFDDIYQAVRPAQETVSNAEYSREEFLQDMRQLTNWELLSCRIEKERLRGYRDVSRQKFRYRLSTDTISFLTWLEERLQEDIEDKAEDTRNLLFDVSSRVRETRSQVRRFSLTEGAVDEARTIIYLLVQLDELTGQVNLRLSDMNANVLGFLFSHYDLTQVKVVLKELEFYVDAYLRQIYALRQELLPNLQQLMNERNLGKIDRCLQLLEEERAQTPQLLKRHRRLIQPGRILKRLLTFYGNDGQLDGLCQRMNASYMKVYNKLKAHLRELERKNNRLEDLNARLGELAALPEGRVPAQFMSALLAPAQQLGDPNFWDDHEKAAPPQPRLERDRQIKTPKAFLRPKQSGGDKPLRSVRQARLERLRTWMVDHLDLTPADRLANGNYAEFEDLRRIFEVASNGLLQKGRNLKLIGYELEPVAPPEMKTVVADSCQLTFTDMTVRERHS
jgi:hypothetical protein